jgi:peroxiredoxin
MPTTTIAQQVTALGEAMAGQPPNEVMGAFAREQAELATHGAPEGVLPAGAKLTDAALLEPHGEATTLYEALGGQTVVVVSYWGAWCPYCNIALNTYQAELLPELTRRGVPLVAVSPQTPGGSLSMKEKNDLDFTVLSDPGNRIAGSFGIVTAPSAEARSAQLQLGLDLTAVNADGATGLPMPATILVDADHVVRWIDVHSDYTTRSEPTEVLAALDALGR